MTTTRERAIAFSDNLIVSEPGNHVVGVAPGGGHPDSYFLAAGKNQAGAVALLPDSLAVLANSGVLLDYTRALSRFRLKATIPAEINATGSGDSYGAGAGATSNNGFMQQLIAAFPQVNWSNYAYASRPISAYRFAPFLAGATRGATMGLVQPTAKDLYVAILGLNDVRGVLETGASGFGCGSNPASKQTLMSRLQSYVTWCLVPEASRVRMKTLNNSGVNPAVTLVTNAGSWGTGAIGSNANILNSNGVGNTASLTTAVGDVLIYRYMSNPSSTGTFTLTIDGVSYGPFSNKSASYGSWVTDCLILKLPNVATHSVVITHTAGDNLIPDSVDCIDSSADFGGVFLYSGPAPLSAAAWAIAPTMNSARANSTAVASAASVSGTTLTVTTVTTGQFGPGQQLVAQVGTGVLAAGTVIQEVLTQTASGVGGPGTFRLSLPATTDGAITSLTVANPGASLQFDNQGRDRFSVWIDEAMTQLFNLGFNTVKVDAMSGYNPTNFEAASDVHPTDLGHKFLFTKFRPYVAAFIGA